MAEQSETIATWLILADEKLTVAQDLLNLSHFDDAISRSYYAMFYAAKAALLAVKVETHSHSGVINQFGQHFVKTGQVDRQYIRLLSLAMQAREDSDYNIDVRASRLDTETLLADAIAFVTKIKEIVAKISA